MPTNQAYFLDPGTSSDVSSRKLTAVRPVLFDVLGVDRFCDDKMEAVFTVDSSGAIVWDIR